MSAGTCGSDERGNRHLRKDWPALLACESTPSFTSGPWPLPGFARLMRSARGSRPTQQTDGALVTPPSRNGSDAGERDEQIPMSCASPYRQAIARTVGDCAYGSPRFVFRRCAARGGRIPNRCSETRLSRKLSGTSGSNPSSCSSEPANRRSPQKRGSAALGMAV